LITDLNEVREWKKKRNVWGQTVSGLECENGRVKNAEMSPERRTPGLLRLLCRVRKSIQITSCEAVESAQY